MTRLQKLTPQDRAQNTKIYEAYDDLEMTDAWHPGNKEENFQRMVTIAQMTGKPLEGTSCLDVGCGTGDLSAFLRERGVTRYIGVDIFRPSLHLAQIKYPQETFVDGDILTGFVTERFDYVFCSGAMTVKLPSGNYPFLEAMVAKMWELSRIGVVFNVLTDDEYAPDPDLFFYNPEKLYTICESIATDGVIEMYQDTDKAQIHFFLYRL